MKIYMQSTVLILCGGLGTRLREVVSDRPKAMALINGRPFLEYQINWLRRQGVTEIILAVGFKSDRIESYFQDGQKHDVNIKYSHETDPLGTGGAILQAMNNHGLATCIVINGDSFINANLSGLESTYTRLGANLCMVCHYVANADRFGAVVFNGDNRLLAFSEKPGTDLPSWINSGIYMLDVSIFSGQNKNSMFSLEEEVLSGSIQREFFVYPCRNEEFIDIGTPKSLANATKFFADLK